MVRDINHLSSRPQTSPQTNPQAKSAEANSKGSSNSPAEAKPVAGSKVELSPQANSPKAAEQLTQSLPDVDLDRVASIRKALDSGEYRVDSQQVADKMLAFDALLAR